VRDCATALQALTGERLAPAAVPDPAAVAGPVGVLTDLFEGAEPAVAAVCDRGLRRLESAGVQLEPVELGWWAPDYGLLLAVEFAAAWRARAQAGPERFPPAILSAIERATEIPAARRGRVTTELAAAREALAGRLGSYSAVLSPTVPIAVPTVDAEEVATSTRFTRIFSALGWPALSLPCGADDHGRPVGLHVSSAGALAHVVRVAALVEQTREL
jgi:aspartyl-tRNA(Asn)/glutamyl-tRNA(Gln) amidotransferase subunit A